MKRLHTFLFSFCRCSCGTSVADLDVCDDEVEVSSSSDAATRSLPEPPVNTSPFTSQVKGEIFNEQLSFICFQALFEHEQMNMKCGVFWRADCEGRDRQRLWQLIPESDGVISTKSACRKV